MPEIDVTSMLEDFKKAREEKENETFNSRILIVDGLNTFIRAFAVNPSRNDDGNHVGGMVGCLKSIGAAIKRFDPTRCIVVFDGEGGSKRRRDNYPEYKSGRKGKRNYNRMYEFDEEDTDEIMKRQIQRTVQYLHTFPVTLVSIDNIEADDVIAYICSQLYSGEDSEKIVMSSDRDFLQLTAEGQNTKVWSPTKKKTYGPQEVYEEYGIPSHNFTVWRIIDGDTSDSIPGVKYVGEKRVQKFLGEFVKREHRQDVQDLVEYCEERTDESATYQRLVDHEDVLDRNWKLMQLHNVDISGQAKMKIRNLVRQPPSGLDRETGREYFSQDKLWSQFSNFPAWVQRVFRKLNIMAAERRKEEG